MPASGDNVTLLLARLRDGNQDAANRVEQAIFDACAFLAEAPVRGHSRPDLTARPLRFWTLSRYPNYVIVYRPEKAPLRIVAVIHGKRDIQHILKRRQ